MSDTMGGLVRSSAGRNRNPDRFATVQLNDAVYTDFYNRLKLLATTAFVWEGLPESINLRFLEKTLFEFGMAVFIKPSNGVADYLVTKVTANGQLNVYDEPVKYHAFGIGFQEDVDAGACVLIRNNPLRTATHSTIELFARQLYEVQRAIDVNVKGQKFPVVIVGTSSQLLTMKNIYMQYDGNSPVIYVDKSLDGLDGIKVLNTGSPYVADKLTQTKHDIWNECMSFLGVNNANTDKKERLITDEVTANDDLIQLAAEAMLATRREACEDITKLFGIKCSVRMKEFSGATEDNEHPDNSEAGAEGGATE